MVGVTNTVFTKVLSHWPHVMSLGRNMRNSRSTNEPTTVGDRFPFDSPPRINPSTPLELPPRHSSGDSALATGLRHSSGDSVQNIFNFDDMDDAFGPIGPLRNGPLLRVRESRPTSPCPSPVSGASKVNANLLASDEKQ